MRVGIIGTGKLGQALAEGLRGKVTVAVANRSKDRLDAAFPEGGKRRRVEIFQSFSDLVRASEVVILAVKPAAVVQVLSDVAAFLPENAVVVSTAAGVPTTLLATHAPANVAVVRAMPNLACAVREGVTALFQGRGTTESRDEAGRVFEHLGRVVWCDSDAEIDAVTAASASGLAFVLVWVEALADAALRCGIPRDRATEIASATVSGAVALMRRTREHPAVLRDRVTSPGGTTIAGLAAMEAAGIRGAIHAAVAAARARAIEMAQGFGKSKGQSGGVQ